MKALEAAALAERQQKKRDRDARYRAKKKASQNVGLPTQPRAENVGHLGKDEPFCALFGRLVEAREITPSLRPV